MKTLTFADTLHPETSQIHVDPQNGSTTVWGTVIHEIRSDLPVAVAVEDVPERKGDEPAPGEVTKILESGDGNTTEVPLGGGCFYLEGLLGCILTLVAVATTFGVELAAAICYCIAAGFYYYAMSDDVPIFVKAIVMVIVHALLVCDAILLTVSLMVTEILGWVAGLVTSIFNPSRCCMAGQAWHVYVRKVCHLTRWAFRGFHEGWALPRRFPLLEIGERELHGENEPPKEPEQVAVAHLEL